MLDQNHLPFLVHGIAVHHPHDTHNCLLFICEEEYFDINMYTEEVKTNKIYLIFLQFPRKLPNFNQARLIKSCQLD